MSAREVAMHPVHVARHEVAAARVRQRAVVERLLGERGVLARGAFPIRDGRRREHDLAQLERQADALRGARELLDPLQALCPRARRASSFAKNRKHKRAAEIIARAASAASPLCAA